MIEPLELTLINKAKQGNRTAFDMLMLTYQRQIARVVRRYLSDPDEVADLVQEIFIKVYQSLASFREESAFYTWLYRIAVNASKNYLWQAKKLPAFEAQAIDLLAEIDSLTDKDNPESLLISEELAKIIVAALKDLPEELQIALILRELNGLNYQQIAEEMHCPIGTVRSRIARAREAIIDKLQQQ
jgi:RNA polymerase sigma-70 factor (ECF subfamily)